jgi:alpha-beta hydrolase superfamily lysophospholipase
LPVRIYGAPGNGPLMVMLHGSGWHGMQFDTLANALSDQAYILVPDLRGHGGNPERRGDVDYIGQYEDDIADLIDSRRRADQTVVVLGHSSGGGLVIRMAGGPYRDRIDQAVLLAPYLHHESPTMRPNSGGWTRPLTRRLIGLSMLNMVGFSAFNHLTVIQFAMPRDVLQGALGHTATTSYSYRLNTGYAPRNDYLKDIGRLPDFLLIAGRADEAFDAAAYSEVMSAVTDKGTYRIVDGVGHLDIVDHPRTLRAIRALLARLQ